RRAGQPGRAVGGADAVGAHAHVGAVRVLRAGGVESGPAREARFPAAPEIAAVQARRAVGVGVAPVPAVSGHMHGGGARRARAARGDVLLAGAQAQPARTGQKTAAVRREVAVRLAGAARAELARRHALARLAGQPVGAAAVLRAGKFADLREILDARAA